MNCRRLLWKVLALVTSLWAGYIVQWRPISPRAKSTGTAPLPATPAVSYASLPLSFEANHGQAEGRVKFLARGRGYGLFLSDDAAELELQVPTAWREEEPAQHPPFSAATVGDYLLPPRPCLENTRNEEAWDKWQRRRGAAPAPLGAHATFRMRLVGTNSRAVASGGGELPGKANYFIGNDPKQWRTQIPTYARVKYHNVYPGIDLVYYGNQSGHLEYDFVVAPGADPSAITLEVGAVREPPSANGEAPLGIAENGDLVISTEVADVRFRKPLVYQEQESGSRNGESAATDSGQGDANNRQSPITNRKSVKAHYVLTAAHQIRFAVGPYDRTRPLIIDPVLVYSTLLAGSNVDVVGSGIAIDSSGDAYVAGYWQPECFVAKLNAEGSGLVYSMYLGGTGINTCLGIAVDSSGNAYVTGDTNSTDFPTVNPFQATNKAATATPGESTAFVSKLSPDGSALVYSTYLGGSVQDTPAGIALDPSGSAYVTGWTLSADFPLANPLQPTCPGCSQGHGDAFVTKFNPAGTALLYSTYLGGSAGAMASGIAVDSSGNALVTGGTRSTDFPTVNPLQATNGTTAGTAFVAKLNAAGSALLYSTYLGGSFYDNGAGVAVDASGNAVVTGFTQSTDFPTLNPLQANLGGIASGFVAKLNAAGSALIYSTYLGGSQAADPNMDVATYASAIALDAEGNAYVTGETDTIDFPLVNAIQSTCPACSAESGDAFVTELNPAGSALVYSTYLGGSFFDMGAGIAVDSSGDAYVTGMNNGTDFPAASPLPPNPQGFISAFVAKIASSPAPGPRVTLSAHNLPFLNDPVGTTSSVESVILRSVGADPLTLTNISISGDFALASTSSSCPYGGGNVVSGAVCTIDVTFTPTETGTRTGLVTIDDNASGSPQNVILTGAGVALAPQAVVSPSILTFGTQWANSVSAPQPVTLRNTGNAPLSITSIAISGGFTETNNCGSNVAAGSFCTINVAFAPFGGGAVQCTMYITDDSNGVPTSMQTVSLNGTGQDFEMNWLPASSSSLTIPPGQSASYTWAVAAVGGFDHAVNFSCDIVSLNGGGPPPSGWSCSVSPSTATPSSTPSNVTVTVNTTASSASGRRTLPPRPPRFPATNVLLILAVLLATITWRMRGWKPGGASGRPPLPALLGAALWLALGLAACGAGKGSNPDPAPALPVSTPLYYLIDLTGTATSGSTTLTNMTNIQVYVP